jgi:hypothetical protein
MHVCTLSGRCVAQGGSEHERKSLTISGRRSGGIWGSLAHIEAMVLEDTNHHSWRRSGSGEWPVGRFCMTG